jgi:hypothetical protein
MNKNIGWPRFTKNRRLLTNPTFVLKAFFIIFERFQYRTDGGNYFFIGANVGGAKVDRNECLSAKMIIN